MPRLIQVNKKPRMRTDIWKLGYPKYFIVFTGSRILFFKAVRRAVPVLERHSHHRRKYSKLLCSEQEVYIVVKVGDKYG